MNMSRTLSIRSAKAAFIALAGAGLIVGSSGSVYPDIQFVTDNSATENACNTVTGQGCVLPPPGPGHFYLYWTLAKVAASRVWEFGNMQNGRTFGGDAEYGKVAPNTIGAFQGPVRQNPTTC
jgi:hypothetical protein